MLLEAAAKLDPSTICTWIGAEGCSDGFQNTGGNAALVIWIHTLEMPCVGIPKTWIEINNLVGGNWNMIFVDFPSYMG